MCRGVEEEVLGKSTILLLTSHVALADVSLHIVCSLSFEILQLDAY